MRMTNEPTSDQSEEVVADIKAFSVRLGLRPGAVLAAYEALVERGAIRIDKRILPKPQHQLSLPLDQGMNSDIREK